MNQLMLESWANCRFDQHKPSLSFDYIIVFGSTFDVHFCCHTSACFLPYKPTNRVSHRRRAPSKKSVPTIFFGAELSLLAQTPFHTCFTSSTFCFKCASHWHIIFVWTTVVLLFCFLYSRLSPYFSPSMARLACVPCLVDPFSRHTIALRRTSYSG